MNATPVVPRCPHFGECGGCQYQHIAYADQLELKREQLVRLFAEGGVGELPALSIHSAEPYGYRNRVRLRIERVDGALRFGYNRRGTQLFLPIVTCPIAAPVPGDPVERVLALANSDDVVGGWFGAATEVEFFCDSDLQRVQMTLLCPPRTRQPRGSFEAMMQSISKNAPQIVGACALAVDPKTGPTGKTFDAWGAAGLNYRVRLAEAKEEAYWVSRGGFFQVNRFLVETLVRLVTEGRTGGIAWDLFAGVGLFSRVLARQFAQVTAVEANPAAANDLRAALKKLGPQHRAVQQTTLEFLREAILQRERPELIVLDPPRAGAGIEACNLLARFAPAVILYVSCDPATLVRDVRELLAGGYNISAVHMVDLFPQTQHIETVVVLQRG